MYYTILQNFVKKLIENEFELVTTLYATETQQYFLCCINYKWRKD